MDPILLVSVFRSLEKKGFHAGRELRRGSEEAEEEGSWGRERAKGMVEAWQEAKNGWP